MPIRKRQISTMSSQSMRLAPLRMERLRNLPTGASLLADPASARVCAIASTTGKMQAEAPLRCEGTPIPCLPQQAKAGPHTSTFVEDSSECFHLFIQKCAVSTCADLHYGEPLSKPASDNFKLWFGYCPASSA